MIKKTYLAENIPFNIVKGLISKTHFSHFYELNENSRKVQGQKLNQPHFNLYIWTENPKYPIQHSVLDKYLGDKMQAKLIADTNYLDKIKGF